MAHIEGNLQIKPPSIDISPAIEMAALMPGEIRALDPTSETDLSIARMLDVVSSSKVAGNEAPINPFKAKGRGEMTPSERRQWITGDSGHAVRLFHVGGSEYGYSYSYDDTNPKDVKRYDKSQVARGKFLRTQGIVPDSADLIEYNWWYDLVDRPNIPSSHATQRERLKTGWLAQSLGDTFSSHRKLLEERGQPHRELIIFHSCGSDERQDIRKAMQLGFSVADSGRSYNHPNASGDDIFFVLTEANFVRAMENLSGLRHAGSVSSGPSSIDALQLRAKK